MKYCLSFRWTLTLFLVVNVACSGEKSDSKDNKEIDLCEDVSITIEHAFSNSSNNWSRSITLPLFGKFVEESHYATTKDSFLNTNFPINQTENIDAHLQRSYEIYQQFDPNATFNELYKNSWNKVWTPSEGGENGQGSIGNSQLTLLKPEHEIWFMTMMWKKGTKPKPGTKFILSANKKSVVVVAGFETGPSSEDFIGGVTCEVHRWLKTNNQSMIKVSYPIDQNITVGPITCN